MKYLIYLVFLLSNLSCSPLIKYSQSNTQFEQEVSLLESLDLEEKAGEKDLLFIGSSSIRLWDNIQVDMYPYSSVKRGYGGAHFYDLIHFSERLVKNHYPKAILIFVANDITGSNDFINLVGDISPNEVKKLFRYNYKSIRRIHKHIPIFLIETTPTPKRWKVWNKILQANKKLERFCKQETNLYFISTRDKFIGDDGLLIQSLFLNDELHLNVDGYKLWSSVIKSKLIELGI
jgi:lysophospholipase L1-like esterase